MFYKYPEEFIVSIVYDNNLNFVSNDSQKKSGLFEDEMLDDKISNDNSLSEKENMKYQNNSLESKNHILKDMPKKWWMKNNNSVDNLEDKKDENNENIWAEIDNEYADSETESI